MKIYGDLNSGNCLKVKWVSDHLALPYDWIDIDTTKGESRTPEFLALNGAGQVPAVELDDGRPLAQSNAADVSLLAYTRVAHEGGFHLDGYRSIKRWIADSEAALSIPASVIA